MAAKLAVLGGDGGPDHVAVDLADRHPVAAGAIALNQVADHRRREGWRHETIGQDPQYRDQHEGEDEANQPQEYPRRPAALPLALVGRDAGFRALRHAAFCAGGGKKESPRIGLAELPRLSGQRSPMGAGFIWGTAWVVTLSD